MGAPVTILLVEDHVPDVRLTLDALRDGRISSDIHVVPDGQKALEFLRHEGEYAHAPRPHLVILDLNLPKMNGHEVLAEMKADAGLKNIPVVILSVSSHERDVQEAYRHQVSCFITKPVDIDSFFLAVRTLKDFWFHSATLPAN